MKRIAIIGSSGGNLYMQGGNDPKALLREIFTQAGSAGIEVGFVEFIGASRSMDNIPADAPAKLYTLDENGGVVTGEEKPLNAVNEDAKAVDAQLAQKIANGEIDGIVLMSSDPKGINEASLTAAAAKKLPCVGTGGTSMGHCQKMGCNVISASGTTGTTNRTRAVAFISALAKEWKIKYSPIIGSSAGAKAQEGNIWKRINFRGIMMASLPGFIAMALTLAMSKIPGLGGLGGLAAGLIGMYLLAPIALWLGNAINDVIAAAIAFNPILAGALAGLLIWPAIIGGVYHAAILPIVLLEMEAAGFSFLGAIDMTGLVMVSAGITLANVLFPRQKSDASAALPGFIINIGFGTFVEAAYPYMFSNKVVFAGALIASTVSGALVGLFDVKGTAYVPTFSAPFMTNPGKGVYFAICMLAAMAIAFAITVFANKATKNTAEN